MDRDSGRSAFATLVRKKLGESTDDALLTAAGWSLASHRSGVNESHFWAEACLNRVLQINPHAVLAHTTLLHIRRQMDFSRHVRALWIAPPDREYESVSALTERER